MTTQRGSEERRKANKGARTRAFNSQLRTLREEFLADVNQRLAAAGLPPLKPAPRRGRGQADAGAAAPQVKSSRDQIV